jgi:ribosomal protein S28E/S33
MKFMAIALLSVLGCSAQIVLPEGTKIRVRLDQNISSATAEEGQTVEFSVTDPVRVGDTIIIAEGARATGVITQAHERRRMGRAGNWTSRSIASGPPTTSGFRCATP